MYKINWRGGGGQKSLTRTDPVKDLKRFYSIFSSIEMTSELSYEPTTVDPGPLSVKQENNSQEHFTSS